MRFLYSSLILCFIVTNCFGQKLGRPPVAEPPYVQLTDMTKIPVDAVHFKSGLIRDKLVTPEHTYKAKEIVNYSNGKKTFHNFDGYGFGEKIADGKIGIYQVIYERITPKRTTKNIRLYVEDSVSKETKFYSYKSINPLIPKNTPAGNMLKKYKKNRTIVKACMFGGLGLFVVGGVIAGSGIMADNGDSKTNAGLYTMLGGGAVICSSFVINHRNHRNMRKAIGIHNGVIKP